MTSIPFTRLTRFALCWLLICAGRFSIAQDADPEEAKEKLIVQRFVTVLEKNPRRGTALDKVYGYHVERGSLESLIQSYRDKAKTLPGPDAGSTLVIVGLLESLRGHDAAAVTALEQAEKQAPQNYLASYYLGQSLVLVGQPDKAVEAIERSIERKPAPIDLLDIYQTLGRIHQRAQRSDKAMAVWSRLEKDFPNDVRVQEQIATTLLEESEFAAALPRFEALAKNTKDKYRQTQYQMEAAGLKVSLGRAEEAIKDFEKLLSELLPDSWLYRDVRRRIELVYLRTDDQNGLITYYENWVKQKPDDLDAIARLARLLAGYGRVPESQQWLQKGLTIAPKSKDLRLSLISQFVYEQKYAEAIAQYEQLDKYEPENPDTLRDWGRLLLKDTKQDETKRKQAAAAIWRKITAAKPKDPLVAIQVADLFRQTEMTDEALELYRRAIALAPDQPQYREYLGEYLHSLKRSDEALVEWRAFAAGKLKTTANVARLAEVLASFGFLPEAIETNQQACLLDSKDFALQVKQVDLLAKADKHEEALTQLAVVRKLAENEEEREAWLSRELRELQSLERLPVRIAEVQKELESGDAASSKLTAAARADIWYWLGRAFEAEHQLKDSEKSLTKASELAPESIAILKASARVQDAQNNMQAAVETNTKLAAIDRRYRTEYLKQVATLEQKMGRKDQAIQAARDAIASAPGNPELYEFFSQLCFQLGETDEGLNALRRSVRTNPSEPKGILLLASALGEQFRTNEAIELYWRAFEKATNLDERLDIVPKLTALYLQINQFDRILERLERQRREPSQMREMTICLANAYNAAGDDGNARQELERLLTEDTRDVQLLTQLVKLCESDGDLDAAVKFQQQLMKTASGKEETMRLAQLMAKLGETEVAMAIFSRLVMEEKEPEAILKSVDSMLKQGNYDSALAVLKKLTRDQPNNWELLYREGHALGKSKEKAAEARSVFEAILSLKLPEDEQCVTDLNKVKKGSGPGRTVADREANPMLRRSQALQQIRQSVGLDDNRNNTGSPPYWVPRDFGLAREGSLAWLTMLARNEGKESEFIEAQIAIGSKAEGRRELIDWWYLAGVTNKQREKYLVLKKLSQRPDADTETQLLYLNSLPERGIGPGETGVAVVDDQDDSGSNLKVRSKLPVLSSDELKHVMNCYRSVVDSASLRSNNNQTYVQNVITELKRAGLKDEADKLAKDTLANAKTPDEIASLIPSAVERNDFETAMGLLNRLTEIKHEWIGSPFQKSGPINRGSKLSSDNISRVLTQLMDKRVQKKQLQDVLKVWDWYAAFAVMRNDVRKQMPANKYNLSSQNRPQGYVFVWRNNSNQYEQLDFPTPNEIYDQSSLQVLRQVYAMYSDSESLPDLFQQFRQRMASPTLSPAEKNFVKFGLGDMLWWHDEKDDALAVLTEATNELSDNDNMKVELARVHEKRGEHVLALEIIDSLPVADQQAMQKREITVLRMAVNSGNIDRARQAAGRLFGLRLDSNLQIQLAQQMHQLGMHEQAEAVLARAGRQAGNRTEVLSSLMQQYQSQGKNDTATQIAYQLLRRSDSKNSASRTNLNYSTNQSTRTHAFTILKRSGKLPEMIKKVETQLKNSPKSLRLTETLIEYYMANGDDKKGAELAASLADSKQDDAQFRYNLGKQLMEQGKHSEAVGHFKVALKKEPKLMRNEFWQLQNSFQSANKLGELASIFDDIDLKAFSQNPWQLTNIISNMSWQEQSKDQAVKLFKRAWKEMPDQRQQLLSSMNNDIFWQMPEIYDYAREGIIPASDGALANSRWPGFGQVMNWGNQDGKIVTLITRFLNLAASKNKLQELTQEIDAAYAKLPEWEAAPTLLALIDLRRNKLDSSKKFFEELLPTFKSRQRGDYTQWEIGQELMAHETCIELAVKYLEAAQKDPNVLQMAQMNGFQYSPGRSLVSLYKRRGQKAEALRLLLSSTKDTSSRRQGNEAYQAYQRIQNTTSLANEVRELGYPIDAIRLIDEQLARSEDFVVAVGAFGGNQGASQVEQLKKQLQTGMQNAIKQLRPETLPKILADSAGDSSDKDKTDTIDLLLLIESRELDHMQLTSALGRLVTNLAKNRYLTDRTRSSLDELLSQKPLDLSLNILQGLLSQSLGETEKFAGSIEKISQLAEQMPLEPVPNKGTFTSAQRAAAKQQVALWLVAREGLKQSALQPVSTKLADRALEASRRLSDNGYSLAILREWGQIAIKAGDPENAKRFWTEMVGIVFQKPSEKNRTNSADEEKKPSTANPATTEPAKSAGTNGQKSSIVTLAQFEQAAQLARMAAKNGLIDLSFSAMAQALQSGPPLEAMVAIDISQNPSVNNRQDNQANAIAQKVQEQLALIDQVWREKNAPEASIYEFLERAVLPDARPYEVFLHVRPFHDDNQQTPQMLKLQSPQNIGKLLAASAVKVGKIERLKELIEPRLKQPLGEISGRILLIQLALAANDFTAANDHLNNLTSRLKQNSSKTACEQASHVGLAGLNEPAVRDAAAGLMEVVIDHIGLSAQPNRRENSTEPMRTFRFALARHFFQSQKPDAGKRQLDEYLNSLGTLYQNYGGDYGHYLRRFEYMKVADEYARAGLLAELLNCLGRYADLPVLNNYGNSPMFSDGVMSVLATTASSDRYRLLKDWTMPTADRKSVRMITGFLSGDDTPVRFDAIRGKNLLPREARMICSANLLIEAAIEAGKLDELSQLLKPHSEQNVEQAAFLLQLTQIAEGKSADVLPALQKLLEERKHPKPVKGPLGRNRRFVQNTGDQLTDGILANAAMKNAELRETGRELLKQFMGVQSNNPLLASISNHDYFAPILAGKVVDQLDHEPWNVGLKHWTAGVHATSDMQPFNRRMGQTKSTGPSWWLTQEGLLYRPFGMIANQVFLNYPITGDFEVTCDCSGGNWFNNAWRIGYGGLEYQAVDQQYAQNFGRFGIPSDVVLKPAASILPEAFNRMRLRVSQDSVKYYVNDDLIHEEPKPSQSSPWFFLRHHGMSASAIRNLKITGQPQIPRTVQLIPDQYLLGWVSDFYSETKPHRPFVATVEADDANEPVIESEVSTPDTKDFDWEVKQSVIHGRRSSAVEQTPDQVTQSWLYYSRPMMDGERIQYEFWYQTGTDPVHVHPALDRLAFLLDPDGVKLHWMTANSTGASPHELSADNLLVDDSIRRGPIKLNEGDWNRVELTLKQEIVSIAVNGSPVAELKLERENGRQFGFYHDKHATAVRVRNVVLSGDWPTQLSPQIAASPLEPSREWSSTERRGISQVINEHYYAESVEDVLLETRLLSVEDRFKALSKWVLPNDDHLSLRTYGTFVSSNSVPSSNKMMSVLVGSTRGKEIGRSQSDRTELVAPILDLVGVADELKRLDQLADQTKIDPQDDSILQRSKLALRTLIHIKRKQFAEATECLNQISMLCGAQEINTPQHERWPELIASYNGLQHAELRPTILKLTTSLVEQQRKPLIEIEEVDDEQNYQNFNNFRQGQVGGLGSHVIALRDRCQSMLNTDENPRLADLSASKQWLSQRSEGTNSHSRGLASGWQVRDGKVTHLGGASDGYLYFQSPLRGTFTVSAEVSTVRWNETNLMYNGHWAGPDHSKKVISLGNLHLGYKSPKLVPELEFNEWCLLKLDVVPQKATYFVNDRQVYEQVLPDNPDPWLALMSPGSHSGQIRQVRISGHPEIPEQIDLLSGNELTGWFANFYGDQMNYAPNPSMNNNADNNVWKKSEGELTGQKFSKVKGKNRPSVIRYHRSLAENGQLSYDFYYIKGETHVHPVIGRTTYLLDPAGVNLHWLGNTDSVRYGLRVDNESSEPNHRRGPAALPLKENDWNTLQIQIAGETLKLMLNEVEIYESPIDPSNQRQFGLFHYANQTDVRVRNILYRGDWPKTLPELNQQELSGAKP